MPIGREELLTRLLLEVNKKAHQRLSCPPTILSAISVLATSVRKGTPTPNMTVPLFLSMITAL